MKYGFGVPSRGAAATPENIVAIAEWGEALGFDYVFATDHLVIPRDVSSRYPYNEEGIFRSAGTGGEYLEILTVLAFVAARTSRLRLLTSVMVLPHRGAVHTAKILATIDVLSGGRMTVGCGVGWMREEFEAIGAPDFDQRGTVGDEYLQAFRELWAKENPSFHGKFVNFEDVVFAPKPVQQGGPPLWVGGESGPALRRAARYGDGWYPIGNNPQFPLRTAKEYAAGLERLRGHAREAGRDLSSLTLAFNVQAVFVPSESLPDGSRKAFTGNAEQVAADIREFGELGVEHLVFRFPGETVPEITEGMERFVKEVRPLV